MKNSDHIKVCTLLFHLLTSSSTTTAAKISYKVFHRFVQAKIGFGDLVLGLRQFLLLLLLPQKIMLALRVVKNSLKMIILLC